jgi:hypothetical protein
MPYSKDFMKSCGGLQCRDTEMGAKSVGCSDKCSQQKAQKGDGKYSPKRKCGVS